MSDQFIIEQFNAAFPTLSFEDCEQLQQHLDKTKNKIRQQKASAVRKQIEELAASLGLSVDEVMNTAQSQPKKAKKPVEPRYRDPSEPTNTWTGRGKQPRWLATKIAEGAKLQDFLIQG